MSTKIMCGAGQKHVAYGSMLIENVRTDVNHPCTLMRQMSTVMYAGTGKVFRKVLQECEEKKHGRFKKM